ncbi:MAG: OmpA family protein, partial [Bacteroidota bacterium]
LDAIAANLTAYPGLGITVEGHTDNTGDQATNDALSQERAQAVAGYLAEQGVDVSRIAAVGYGDARPIATNSTDEGRAANRRVAFRVG